MKASDIKALWDKHHEYWDHRRKEMERYDNAYKMDFWDERRADSMMYAMSNTQLNVQTSDGYGYIEGFIASLFAKNPAVSLKAGIENKGTPSKAEAVANAFLLKTRAEVENVSRLALIFPQAYIKLVPMMNQKLHDKVCPVSLCPWEVILDRDAPRWDRQRFVGHRYFMPLDEAKEKFGNKSFQGKARREYLDYNRMDPYEDTDAGSYAEYVEIIEMYDLVNDELTFYCEDLERDNKVLQSGFIPFRDVNNRPVCPICPLYFNRQPAKPLDGYSAMRRVYDQLFEINVIRSFQANAVRKASRQYLVKSGLLDEEQMAQLTSGIDGLFIEVDEENLEGVMRAVPQNPSPPELERYYAQVQEDKNKGSLMAPFTRGESSRVTATEAVALASYTASEIGRMARERDAMIEYLASTYLSILATFLEEEPSSLIQMDGKVVEIKPDDLRGDFSIYASDQASTPLSDVAAKNQLLNNIPTLVNLGVPAITVLKEVVRVLNLPEDFVLQADANIKEQQAAQQAQAAQMPGGVSGIEMPPTREEAIANASTKAVRNFIPEE
jgi:hypothetical protein